ncbi:uncharacterized protein [Amphiura filiformis]|uniref:uncharacterized protein isoform X2 n=1 Tax=Amphiura filiformis TaxID=82378 RepID=UPI003B21CC20
MYCRTWLLATLDLLLISSTFSLVVPDLIATFNMKGVNGTASFIMNESGDVRILLDLQGFPADTPYKWSIYNKAMLYDRENPCDAAYVGAVHPDGDLTSRQGQLQNSDFGNQYLESTIKLTGPKSVDGRTLVFEQDSNPSTRVCAQLIANANLITAIATIDTPFAGQLIFRQPRNDPTAVTTIYMDVYDIVDPIENNEYTWQISDNSGLNYDMTNTERCGATYTAIYDPTNIGDANCAQDDPSMCAIGDFSGKFGSTMVQTVPNKSPEFYVDTNLPLTGSNSIMGKTLVFRTGQIRHVCAQIRELQPKTVTALFSASNVSGSITFKQSSPFDATTISVDITNLRDIASGYHVHKFPVPLKYYENDQLPSDNSVSGHFNPYGKPYPLPIGMTNDEYEIGDISGKFGNLAGLDELNTTYVDWNMPLFGKNSVVGRSVIIHKEEAAERWIYGTIGYPSSEVKTLQSVFTSPVVGKIVLRQPINDPLGDTSVWVEVAYSDGSSTTENHNWHIHQLRVANDYLSDEGRCSSTAGHDNPFDAEVGNLYSECTPDNPGRCELGDLTGKLGTFTIPATVGDKTGKNFWTDARLPLSGANSVASKSIVIHYPNRGAPRLACADLLEVPKKIAKADMWTNGPVSGDITLSQQFETDPATVDSWVEGLGQEAAGWHVHNLPVPYDEEVEPCSGASVQGHYNPFNIAYGDEGPPKIGTNDMYEVGDLSAKFDSFAGLDSYAEASADTNLYLYGPRSVVGRSIVIHRNDLGGTRWVCATLIPDYSSGNAYTVMATATFTMESQIVGTVTLSQTHYGEENYGETTMVVEVDSENADSVEVDDSLMLDIRLGDEEACSPDNLLYNPYQVDTGDTYDDDCDLRSQLRCQVGDLVGKHDEFSTSVKKVLYTDINLPLGGRASVLGHSLLVRSSTSDDSYACVPITPDPDTGIAVTYAFPMEVEYESYNFRTQLDSSLSEVDMWNIVSTREPTPHPEIPECQSITFYLIGPNQQDMLADFNKALKQDNLGDYSPTSLCEESMIEKYRKDMHNRGCVSQPCMNGARCYDRSVGFYCKCRRGFRGKTCNIQRN